MRNSFSVFPETIPLPSQPTFPNLSAPSALNFPANPSKTTCHPEESATKDLNRSPTAKKNGATKSRAAKPSNSLFNPRRYPIVSTTRNSAFPLSILSYASFTFASGYFSIIGRTPANFENSSVSCESLAVPDGNP